jgi:hypothetical protein
MIGAFVGYELAANLGVEFQFIDFGTSSYKSRAPFGGPFFPGVAFHEVTNQTRAITLMINGKYPLRSEFRLTASGGIAAGTTKADVDIQIVDGPPAIVRIADDTSSSGYVVLGLGAEWLPHPKWLIRVGVRRYINLDSGVSGLGQQVDMTSLSGGVAFRF